MSTSYIAIIFIALLGLLGYLVFGGEEAAVPTPAQPEAHVMPDGTMMQGNMDGMHMMPDGTMMGGSM